MGNVTEDRSNHPSWHRQKLGSLTPLLAGHSMAVRLLLTSRADVHICDEAQETAVTWRTAVMVRGCQRWGRRMLFDDDLLHLSETKKGYQNPRHQL